MNPELRKNLVFSHEGNFHEVLSNLDDRDFIFHLPIKSPGIAAFHSIPYLLTLTTKLCTFWKVFSTVGF